MANVEFAAFSSSGFPLCDLRRSEDFDVKHIRCTDGRTVVNLPFSHLRERSAELPPRSKPFAVVMPSVRVFRGGV